MKKSFLIPATGIVVTAVALVAINEFTELTFVREYAYLLIVAAMLVGVVLARIGRRTN